MNGAESLVRTLLASDVDVCFANPGTSEMHFVAALDRVDGMRCVLGLFEGVVSGAADGYARMADKPASTLLPLSRAGGHSWPAQEGFFVAGISPSLTWMGPYCGATHWLPRQRQSGIAGTMTMAVTSASKTIGTTTVLPSRWGCLWEPKPICHCE